MEGRGAPFSGRSVHRRLPTRRPHNHLLPPREGTRRINDHEHKLRQGVRYQLQVR